MQLLVEEGLTELASKDRELLHNAQLNAPVLVLGEVSEAGNNRLLQVFDPDHRVQAL